ncbi:hypothetical protein [Sphingomonas sp. Leaf4]|uniref:hypothetical protein n=1 Tax=Sphingomonas sp. Leaf4 TaxID=2876553 RepID=UPI001E574776|nr:hypothetical protein [Sphingomonas sp. Leaf4]
MAIGFLPLIGAMAVQDKSDKDIVVVGPSLNVRPGEWLFERGKTFPLGNYPGRRVMPGFKYRMCIGEGDMRDAIGMMLGADPGMAGSGTCAPPKLRIANGRIEGGYRCSFGRHEFVQRVSGTVVAETVDLTINSTYELSNGSITPFRSTLKARRLGECPPK